MKVKNSFLAIIAMLWVAVPGTTFGQSPTVSIFVQQNTGNGTIRVGGNYTNADYITIDCVNLTDGTDIRNQQTQYDGKNWWYDKPVVAGKRYKFAVRAFSKSGAEKWAIYESVTANAAPQPNPTPSAQPQTKQTLTKPQWVQELPTNVVANQYYTISWKQVANAQKYRVYFTQGGSQKGYDYTPAGTSQSVIIPDISGTAYIGIIAMPDYSKFNQSDELTKAIHIWRLESINKDRWTNHDKSITIYNDWNPSNRYSIGTIPKGTKVNVRDKFVLGNEAYALIWTYNKEQGNYSGNMYVNANDLREAAPQFTYTTQPMNNVDRWINKDNVSVYSDVNLTIRKSSLDKGKKVKVSYKYIFNNNKQVAQIEEGYVNANDLTDLAPTTQEVNYEIEKLSYNDYVKAFSASNEYDYKFAYWCGKVSNDAYDDSSNRAMNTLEFVGIEPKYVKIVDNEILTYYVGTKNLEKPINGKTLITMIVIKGTDPKKSSNLMADVLAYPVIWKTGLPSVEYVGMNPLRRTGQALSELIDQTPEAHGGFFSCAKTIWEQININSNSLYIVTGHSLGGAIAELIGLHLAEELTKKNISVQNIISYGFASPPVGDGDLRTHAQKIGIRSRIHKLQNRFDAVPTIAGWIAFTIAGDKKTFNASLGGHSMEKVYLPQLEKVVKGTISSSSFTTESDEEAISTQSKQQQTSTQTLSSSTTTQQQSQTYTTSNFARTGNAALRNYAGKNYIGDINATNGFRFTVNSTTAQTATFSITYRSDNRGGKLSVNGSIQNVIFSSTNWNWGTRDVQIQLRQGQNTIEFYGGFQTEYAPDIAEITIKM